MQRITFSEGANSRDIDCNNYNNGAILTYSLVNDVFPNGKVTMVKDGARLTTPERTLSSLNRGINGK